MKGNNKKKNKNYYKYHNHHNHNNKFYYKNNKKHNKYFYYHKKKNRHKENQVINEQNSNDKNILLSELQQDIEEQILNSEELNNNNLVQQAVSNIVQENDYEELEFVPIKKSESKRSYGKKFTFKHAIAIFIIIAVLFGVTYSYFTFTKVDSRQADITSGDVYVTIVENSVNLTLNKMYPRTSEEARARDDNYIDFTVKGKNTSPTKELVYTVTITNGTDVQGKTRINPQYLLVDLQEKVNNEYVYVKNAVSLSTFDFSSTVPVNTTSEITKEYRLRIWVSDAITISDTETGATYTQAQFANLYANVHVDVNSEDRVAPVPICKRAKTGTLHTETCNNGSSEEKVYCYADGYYEGGAKNMTIITYGILGTTGQAPQVGDAFDCDVNGDGIYDSITERFYYVSDYYDTVTESFDSTYATLIYYSNMVNGVISDDGGSAYYGTSSSYNNWHGPTAAILNLPNNKSNSGTWRDDLIKTQDRKILACSAANCTEVSDSTDGGPITYVRPIYNGKAARLLTLQEVNAGCGTGVGSSGSLSGACNFLMENTKYADASKRAYGPWLENPLSSSSENTWLVAGNLRRVVNNYSWYTTRSARPVIDIPKSQLAY